MSLTALSDAELVSSLRAVCAEGHRLVARLVVHLAEVEQRSLHLKAACSSMFDFCVRQLRMSEGTAFRRINAARLVRRFPSLLGRLERGEVHLSTLVLLAKHLTEANVDELFDAVAGKSLRQVEVFLARYAPKPDVPDRICKLPAVTAQPLSPPIAVPPANHAGHPMRIEPLSEDRYKVRLTAGAELRDKLERARDLMRHRNPSGDLAVVVERALDALLDRLEKERLGKTTRPRRNVRRSKRGVVARAVRREVFERDGEQCTFRAENGERCPSRALLELDHVESRARGGSDEASNLRVRCRSHNRLHAEDVFGKEYIAGRIDDLRHRKLHRTSETNEPREIRAEASELECAFRGLVNLGFAKPDARRALDDISRRYEGDRCARAAPELLREAIAALT